MLKFLLFIIVAVGVLVATFGVVNTTNNLNRATHTQGGNQ